MKDKFISVSILIPILLIGIGIFIPIIGKAQDCSTSLRDAQHSYEVGDFRTVLGILSPCVEKNLNSDDTWRGYRLMAISYLLLDNPDSADISMRRMLARNPLYIPNPAIDPEEFIKALNEYEYYPKISLGAQVGFIDPLVKLLSANTVTQTYSTQSDYSGKFAPALGLNFEYHFIPFLSISIGGDVTPQEFTRTSLPVLGKSVAYTESISSISFPVILHFDIIDKVFKPFIEAGAFAQLLTSATGSISFNSTGSSIGTATVSNINSLERRKTTNYGFVLGAGVARSFTSPLSELRLTAHYWNGLRDMTRPDARYASPALYQSFYYVDDEIALHGFEMSLSFIFHLSLTIYHSNE